VKRRLVLSYVSVTAIILIALEVPLGVVYSRNEQDVASSGLQHDAAALSSLVEEGIENPGTVDLVTVADRYRAEAARDVEIVNRAGRVLVVPRAAEPELSLPVVRARVAAVATGGSVGVRLVRAGDEELAIASVGPPDAPVGAVVVSGSDAAVDRRVHNAWLALGLLAMGVLAAVALLGAIVARSVTRPLTELERVALRLGGGDLSARARADRGPPEARALSRSFNEMAARLEELVTAQRAFVADASHQLRSPLTALRLRLENVAATLPPDEGADDVDAVLAELDRLSRVVDGLLLLARSEGKRPERTAVDAAAVVADRCQAWAALAEEAGVHLEGGTGPAVAVRMVPGYLDQILDNLLANALEATPAGHTVRVDAALNGGVAEIHVIDEGRGMSEEDRRRAFDRFWRGSGTRAGSGSGLGLAIVRQLAPASGAEAELLEAPGGGVDAVVRIPSARLGDLPRPAPAPLPDGPIPDGPIPDSAIPGSPVPDGPVSDGPVSDSPVSESPV
jgi:signal transduction histidine kinase